MNFMTKISIIFIYVIFFIFETAYPQSDSIFKFVQKIDGNFSYFTVDHLNNIYVLTNGNQLKKISEKGDSLSVFNDIKRFGYPTYIDVNNPLKILLYYKKFSTVIVLDRFLNMRNTINLRKQNIFTVNAISTAYDNNIWVFDEQNYKLKKIDEEGKVLQETADWRNLLEEAPSPNKIIDRDNFVYVYDSAKGFYIFDYYGSFKNKLTFTGWQNVEVNGKILYGFNNHSLFTYQLQSLSLKEFLLPNFFNNYTSIKAINGNIYLLKNDGIYHYKVINSTQ